MRDFGLYEVRIINKWIDKEEPIEYVAYSACSQHSPMSFKSHVKHLRSLEMLEDWQIVTLDGAPIICKDNFEDLIGYVKSVQEEGEEYLANKKKTTRVKKDEVADKKARVKELYAELGNYAAVARELGISPTTARKWGKE